MLKSSSLKLTFEELKAWLESERTFDPPKGDTRQKELNLIMSIVVLLKIFNENPRRVSDDFGQDLDALNEVLDTFDMEKAKSLSLKVLQHSKKSGEKLCPIPMDTLKVLLYAMADLGLVKPPPEANEELITSQILNCRAILYSFASNIGKKIEDREKGPDLAAMAEQVAWAKLERRTPPPAPEAGPSPEK